MRREVDVTKDEKDRIDMVLEQNVHLIDQMIELQKSLGKAHEKLDEFEKRFVKYEPLLNSPLARWAGAVKGMRTW